MAVAESITTNATQAIKMNITFWNSPMPNSDKVSGITAATGMLRPPIIKGAKKAFTRRKQPQIMPKGMPTIAASPKPRVTRFKLARVFRVSAWSNQRLLKSPKVSAGLGNLLGLTRRFSAISPAVSHHQIAPHTQTHNTPRRTLCQTGISTRSKPALRGRLTGAAPAAAAAFPEASLMPGGF